MGVGKTAVSRELQKILPDNVFLDGDWCWDMRPFKVTEETKEMELKNISFLLNSFIDCSEYQNIIFCWVLHKKEIIDDLISRLKSGGCEIRIFTLQSSAEILKKRLLCDVEKGIRKPDVIERSVARIKLYDLLKTEKIDTDKISAEEAAKIIKEKLYSLSD
jgi:AAA15 family ATPase/GTPase